MRALRFAVLATTVATSGCLVLFHDPDGDGGAPPASSAATENATATSTGSGSGECAAACVEAAPEGWLGPISLRDGASCSPDEALVKTVGVDATETETCLCSPDVSPCAPPEVNLYTSANCTGAPTGATAGNGECTLASSTPSITSFKIDQIPSFVPNASCEMTEPQPDPVPAFTEPHALCSREGSCSPGKSCVSSGDICIYTTEEDTACPQGSAYQAQRGSLFEVATSTCACGTRPHGSCAGDLESGSENTCTGAGSKVTQGTDLTCQHVSYPLTYLRYDPTAEPRCDPGEWQPVKTAIHLCCLE